MPQFCGLANSMKQVIIVVGANGDDIKKGIEDIKVE